MQTVSSRIISRNYMQGISLLTKNVTKLMHPPGVDCPPFPWTFMGYSEDEEKSYPTAKNYSFPPSEKSPLVDLNISLSKVSFLTHQTAIFKQSSYAIFICSCSHFCCIIFYISGCMYTHVVLIWPINVNWMLPSALNDWSSPKKNFHSLHSSNAISKTLLLLLLVFLFFTLSFLFQTL